MRTSLWVELLKFRLLKILVLFCLSYKDKIYIQDFSFIVNSEVDIALYTYKYIT